MALLTTIMDQMGSRKCGRTGSNLSDEISLWYQKLKSIHWNRYGCRRIGKLRDSIPPSLEQGMGKNRILRSHINKFVIIYLNGIIIYFKFIEKHQKQNVFYYHITFKCYHEIGFSPDPGTSPNSDSVQD